MFLNMLNEKEKKYFLELADIAKEVDGVITDSEEDMMLTFRKEMSLQNYELQHIALNKLKLNVDMSTKKAKKVILFELTGMMYADNDVAEIEKEWLLDLATSWGFRENELKKIIRWVLDFNDLLMEGYEFINRKEHL